MLAAWSEQPECLWDDTLPIEMKELPADLAALGRSSGDGDRVPGAVAARGRRDGRLVLTDGPPTIAMETYAGTTTSNEQPGHLIQKPDSTKAGADQRVYRSRGIH